MKISEEHGHAITQVVGHWLSNGAAQVLSQLMWDLLLTICLGKVVSEYFSFSFQFSFHQLLHIHCYSITDAIQPKQLTALLNNLKI